MSGLIRSMGKSLFVAAQLNLTLQIPLMQTFPWTIVISTDRTRSRTNLQKANSLPRSAKMYSHSLAYSSVPLGRDYLRNPTPSSLPFVSSFRTCDRSKFMHGITFFRIWKLAVPHPMTLLA